jgi:hypothetical protein
MISKRTLILPFRFRREDNAVQVVAPLTLTRSGDSMVLTLVVRVPGGGQQPRRPLDCKQFRCFPFTLITTDSHAFFRLQ